MVMCHKEVKLWDIYMVLNDLFLLCNKLSMRGVCKKIESVEYKLQHHIALLNNPRISTRNIL